MDGDQTDSGFVAAGLAQVAPTLQGVVDAGDLSGVVSLIWRKGQVVQVDTIGRRDIAGDLPMTRDTLFRIASMTKPVTSVAALMLVEEGKLKLDDPITRWLPEFSGMQVLKDATGSLEDTYPAPRDITVEDLMTHCSGLAYGSPPWAPSLTRTRRRSDRRSGRRTRPTPGSRPWAACRFPIRRVNGSTTATPPRSWASWSPASRASPWARS
jgi:CubicO group peptidase (beta-lactamase class C family)